jgi:hypothetical protein
MAAMATILGSEEWLADILDQTEAGAGSGACGWKVTAQFYDSMELELNKCEWRRLAKIYVGS